MHLHLEPGLQQKPTPVVASSSWSRAMDGRPISWPRLGGTTSRPAATSWTKAAQPDKLTSERSVGKPPRGGILSVGGGMARREQALRACICCGVKVLSSCNGGRKALMYLLAPSRVSSV